MECQGYVGDGKKCGRILSPDAKFCADCGTKNEGPVSINCTCGVIVRTDHKFCHNCGQRVRPAPSGDAPPKLCTGKNEDGSPCSYRLLPSLSFCPNCGTKAPTEQGQERPLEFPKQPLSTCTAELSATYKQGNGGDSRQTNTALTQEGSTHLKPSSATDKPDHLTAAEPDSDPSSLRLREKPSDQQKCSFCQAELGHGLHTCSQCGAIRHDDSQNISETGGELQGNITKTIDDSVNNSHKEGTPGGPAQPDSAADRNRTCENLNNSISRNTNELVPQTQSDSRVTSDQPEPTSLDSENSQNEADDASGTENEEDANQEEKEGDWCKFDGVVYPEGSLKEGLFDKVKGAFGYTTVAEKIQRDVIRAAKEYLPSVEEILGAFMYPKPQQPAEDFLQRAKAVMNSISSDETLRQQCFVDNLITPLLHKLNDMLSAGSRRTAALAMFIFLLKLENDVFLDGESINLLCRAMLIIPDVESRTCPDLDDFRQHFPLKMQGEKNLALYVQQLIDKSDVEWRHKANPSWLCCVPMLHFLEGSSFPFEEMKPSVDSNSDDWWGISGFTRRKDRFKSSFTKMTGAFMDTIELFGPSFAADPLLARTVVASLDFDPLLPVLCKAPVPVEMLSDVLEKMKNRWEQFDCQSPVPEHHLRKSQCQAALVCQMLKLFLQASRYFDNTILMASVHLGFLAINKVACEEESLCSANDGVLAQGWMQQARDVTKSACDWISSSYRLFLVGSAKSMLPVHLKMWGQLLQRTEQLTHKGLKQELEKLIADKFEAELNRLSKSDWLPHCHLAPHDRCGLSRQACVSLFKGQPRPLPPDDKLEVFVKQQEQVVPAFMGILSKLTFESLEEAFRLKSSYLTMRDIRLVSLLSTLLEQKWHEKTSKDGDVLTFVVTWVPMVNYLQEFRDSKSLQNLSKKAEEIIEMSVRCIDAEYEGLKTGQILIKTLQFLLYNREQFGAIAEATGREKKLAEGLLMLRGHELQTFMDTSEDVDKLMAHCQEFLKTNDLRHVQRQLEHKRESISRLSLAEVSEIALPDSITDLKQYKPKTNPWKLPDDIVSVLPEFGRRLSSMVFRKLLSREAEKHDIAALTFWRAFQVLWSEVNKEWKVLCTRMRDGTISLQSAEIVFRIFRSEGGGYKFAEIDSELQKMCGGSSTDWVDERIRQFKCYTDIKKHVKAARAVLQVRDAYDIKGNFKNIEKICSLSQNAALPIRDLDESVLGLCKQLEDITPQDIECLKGFTDARCKEFILWLRENMKDGLKELNVFVDLAFISAGEEPMAIGRVNCFHAAATGYAPLIFTDVGSCEHMLQQCRLVFKNIAADKHLPEKLVDTSPFLEWFKDVQKSHGSVEKTSLSQVGNINARGVFRVGSVKKFGMNLHQVIHLDVSEDDDGKTPPRKYTYEELLDLQSRLMLVAGQAEKGKENVDRFITVMDSLVRLGKTYVQLCADGCVLFLDWSVKFLCDSQRPVCCISEFASQSMLKGRRGRQDLEEFIMGVAGFLEQCHTEWLQYVDEKRRDYPQLNVYTVEQLVFLQQELVKLGGDGVSKHVYPMLSLLKESCSPADLEAALQEAMDEVDRVERQWTQHKNVPAAQEQEEEMNDEEKVVTFLSEMLDSGFPRPLALKAMKEVGREDIAGGIAWCMQHEDDSDIEEGEEMDTDTQTAGSEEIKESAVLGQRLKEWVTRTESITQSAIGWLKEMESRAGEETLKALTDSLRIVWRKFLETVSSSGTDFFSLEHLGIILRCLAAKDERVFNRSLPPNFNKPGIPNLILCPRNEVLNAVTYMYMFPEDGDPPLPQPDEVLLCTDHTTFQQQQKVYCLAFADSLDYDVGEKTEKKIKDYVSKAGAGTYKLVVVCTTENEYRARIVAAMEKYRRPTPALSNSGKVRSFLRTRFAGLINKGGKQSASSLDPESLCVRVVRSCRSGVGKTLYKQRQDARLKKCNPREKRVMSITIPLHSRVADTQDIAARLLQHTLDPGVVLPRIIHLDISYQKGHSRKSCPNPIKCRQCYADGHKAGDNACTFVPVNNQNSEMTHTLYTNTEGESVNDTDRNDTNYSSTGNANTESADRGRSRARSIASKLQKFRRDSSSSVKRQRSPHGTTPPHIDKHAKTRESAEGNLDLTPGGQDNGDTGQHVGDGMTDDSVQEGVDHLLYNLLVLGCATDTHGHVWLRSTMDLYLVETMPLLNQRDPQRGRMLVHQILDVLPSLNCWSPQDSVNIMKDPSRTQGYQTYDQLFDDQEFRSETFQRPYQYLQRLDTNQQPQAFDHTANPGQKSDCLAVLLKYCGVLNPSWSELTHFVCFLNKQLQDFEHSVYCGMATSADLPGFSDFATRSLKMSEESLAALTVDEGDNVDIEQYEMRRTWESSPHPYIFFNPDEHSMTFLGFSIDAASGNLVDQQTGRVLEQGIMTRQLYQSLMLNRVPLTENFDVLPREDRLLRLYRVLGLYDEEIFDDSGIIDPDDTYELTTDNVKKILAIYMRFRCNIPVIVMGETGCGKTRLVEFLCALQTPKNRNMKTMVHGGTSGEDIMRKVHEAEKVAQANAAAIQHRPVYTVLFFDEANTTEAVGVIKEVMCDGTMAGQPVSLNHSLKMVAACNPYRKHSDELIQRLENAGLGYHVDADKTVDKLGRVPMRRLVYRVQPLPQSMLPLVWDFGQLNTRVEELYIRQMVRRYVRSGKLAALDEAGMDVMCKILMNSQEFMRKLEEASDMTMALVLSLGVCYRACLRSKDAYDEFVVPHFQSPFDLPGGQAQFLAIIDKCQEVFLDNVRLEDNIARNQALKENVFMMVVCIELRIPLFLVGKPGSSKSLAKTIVADAMQGNSSYSYLFKELKQAQMVSFQCSPLATADGILGTFRQCAQFQKGKDMDSFVSVVVLDEVGLAEDSPRMPLKTLHPLLEDGCPGDEVPEACKKVAFIGISNWALDPAKMNRGILVQRDVPNNEELIETARGICTTRNELALENVKVLIPKLAEAYLSIFEEAKQKREFFGLRDFYSLVKMVYAFAARSRAKPSQRELIAAIRRNFGGLDTIDPVKSFRKLLPTSLSPEPGRPGDPDCTPSGLIKAALSGDDMGGETRYLLLLSENYGGLTILSENLLADRHVVPIFGSSFPKDQEYTQICRNINRIKVCMETGQTVILLNLDNLYESLYDALNQYYAMLGGERYVDLGLGTHRVKCRVHRDFRLIVVAEKQAVYENFPIPLINRLEKHFLTLNNIMTEEQLDMAKQLEKWAEKFVNSGPQAGPFFRPGHMKKDSIGDVFMGYHPDAAPAIVLKVWNMLQLDTSQQAEHQVLRECQQMLLWCATPDAVVRSQESEWGRVYNEDQQHEHLAQYLQCRLEQHPDTMLMAQVTTHSKLLTEQERLQLCDLLPVTGTTLLSLQSFDTEQQFCQQLTIFFKDEGEGSKLLLVQCDSGDTNQNLIKCAQYCMQDLRPANTNKFHVVFIIQLPRIAGACFTGFLGGNWHCLHIDDLRAPDRPVPSITQLQSQTPAALLMAAGSALEEQMDINYSNNYSPEMQFENGEQTEERPEVVEEEQMDVDLEDVHISLQSGATASPVSPSQPHADWAQPQGFDAQYVQYMLTTCVQNAVALVRDPDSNISRATRRITVILELMEGNAQFFAGLRKMVGSILKEREEKLYQAERWLSKEAAKREAVNKAGTFRRAWQQCLENKVIPVLAGIIAYLDTNANLEILYTGSGGDMDDSATPAWVPRLWLGVLQNVCQLTYRNMRSVSDKEELDEFSVHNTGAGAVPFTCRLPFSWLVYEHVDSAITGARTTQGDLLSTAGSVVETSALGKCLKAAVGDSEDDMKRMFQFYISDLLYFMFPLVPQEHQLLCVCVEKGVQQLGIELVQLEVGRGLVALHMLLDQMRPRLQSILDMAAARPNAIQALVTGSGAHTQLLATQDEMTEDVTILTLLVEELQPRPSQLDDEEGYKEWMAHYNSVAPAIIRVLSDASSTNRTCLWTKEMTLKLFLDFIVPLKQGPQQTRTALGKIKLYLLWRLLDDDANMKDARSLKNVDKFLKHANGFMLKGLLGKVGNCAFCDLKLETAPVVLPCKHLLCNSCFRDSCPGTIPGECPQCHRPVPQTFDPASANPKDRVGLEQLGRYQRQVSGFLMALVSKLCFAGHEPPEPDAVRHIFGYITHRSKGRTLLQTKHMTVHDDLIDPTPVLRSFLLRLLIRQSEDEVMVHLDEFLKTAKEIVKQQKHLPTPTDPVETPTLLEFSLLIIHCIEDLHHEEEAVKAEGRASLSRDPQQHLFLSEMIHDLRHTLRSPSIELTTLYSLGRLRYTLDACARILHDVFVASGGTPVLTAELEDLLAEIELFLRHTKGDWPKKFLIKQLCREFGMQAYMALAKTTQQQKILEWILLEESTTKVEEVPDRYLVCGEHYKAVRDGLSHLKLGGSPDDFTQVLKALPLPADQQETVVLLALHREVTMSNLRPMPDEVRTARVTTMKSIVQECDAVQDKELGVQLCENRLGPAGSPLCVHQAQDIGLQSLACILTHLKLALRPTAAGSHLLHPLHQLIFQPAAMNQAFLPTMPQDNLDEIMAATRERLWHCPNGHRYLIGDGYVPAAQNAPDTGADQTQQGHILGAAAQRGVEVVPERQLSAVECALTRFLTHAALYLGASIPNQADQVCEMVHPRIVPQDVCQFFWHHLQRDLQVLQRVTGRGTDDIYLVLHHLCHQMTSVKTGGNPVALSSKQERATWERQFATTFIAPTVQTIDNIVQRGNRLIVSDTRQGESELLRVVYEVQDQAAREDDIQQLQTSSAVWRYRPRITVEHFFREFHLQVEAHREKKAMYPVIRLFKAESHILRALHYVPAIMAGQRRLMMQLHRRLDRAEAVTLTIQEVLTRKECSGLEKLMEVFSKAWEIVKEHLITHRCVAPMEGFVSLPVEFHNTSITLESPLAVLLPSTRGPGLCSYMLLQYLLSQHNQFLQRYCPLIKQSYKSLPEVSVRVITERHLVGYSPERDILPMVLAHCNYSLMVGQAATLEYDFPAFQQQLQDTLLQCKTRVQRHPDGYFPVETMVYRADTTSSRLFRILREKISQESLSLAERRQILDDLRDKLSDICQSIDNLNTTLSFLKALGGSPTSSLHDFMSQALRMKQTIHSRKAQQICSLGHVQSLWILLCHQRASILAAHRQDAFDSQEKELRVELSDDQEKELEKTCQRMSIERLELLLLQLFECIMLRLSEPRDQDDDTQPDNFRLRDVLMSNLDSPLYEQEPVEISSGLLTQEDLAAFPESLQGRHSTCTWLACHKHLAQKRQHLL
ncbi:hypothetical protein BaRGS_00013998, partial [Batillaria attramentaria]